MNKQSSTVYNTPDPETNKKVPTQHVPEDLNAKVRPSNTASKPVVSASTESKAVDVAPQNVEEALAQALQEVKDNLKKVIQETPKVESVKTMSAFERSSYKKQLITKIRAQRSLLKAQTYQTKHDLKPATIKRSLFGGSFLGNLFGANKSSRRRSTGNQDWSSKAFDFFSSHPMLSTVLAKLLMRSGKNSKFLTKPLVMVLAGLALLKKFRK
ncbi:hypothetical protein [Brackiella oedipodis]|uniref:hypothetical protein n=1 Tax=Brackiella oedipodis TaxID=124225 RepID=UPI0004904AC2|nr:hypothetical protein [Brackiella oedipodis]